MKKVWTGIESSGKDLHLSIEAYEVLQRNRRWIKIREKLQLPYVPRTMAFMAPMKPHFVEEIQDGGCIYLEFKQFNEISHFSRIFIHRLFLCKTS